LISPDSKARFGVASQNYYPEFLAALEIARENGITPGALPNHGVPAHREFKVTEEMPLEKLVSQSGLSQAAFLRLNPAVTEAAMKGEAPIPAGYVARFAAPAAPTRKRSGKR
jgi:membrane-bound lytic murein transglycosylase D